MAPEVILSEKYNIAADIYSFALCLFELVIAPSPIEMRKRQVFDIQIVDSATGYPLRFNRVAATTSLSVIVHNLLQEQQQAFVVRWSVTNFRGEDKLQLHKHLREWTVEGACCIVLPPVVVDSEDNRLTFKFAISLIGESGPEEFAAPSSFLVTPVLLHSSPQQHNTHTQHFRIYSWTLRNTS